MGTVSRIPQTTAQPTTGAGVPFTRQSRDAQILGPSQSGQAMGALWTPILKPVGGYMSSVLIYLTASGSTLTGGVLPGTNDAPWNGIQNLYFRDPFGQPIIQASGYSLYLIGLYSGQMGMLGFGNQPTSLPSYNAITPASGNFGPVRFVLPLQLDSSAYCSLPSMNAASQPQLQVQFATLASIYQNGTTPTTGTAPTLLSSADEPFWMAPVDNPQIAPPDIGSSCQWSEVRAAAGVSSGVFQRIQLPRVGTFIHTLILTLRDSTNTRIDAWPTGDLTLWLDGVPIMFESFNERIDRMYQQFGVTRPTGVIAYTFRDSVQTAVSTADTYDRVLPTTPATLLEISGTFGTITNAPATITQVTGELFPVGGIPYTHLAN
jgi:hypothetical protein